MIIISSYGFRKPFVREKLQGNLENPQKMKVLLIPLAGWDVGSTVISEIRGLELFGFVKENIYVFRNDSHEHCLGVKYDLIYVPGGYIFKLLQDSKKFNLIDWLKKLITDDEVNYFGVSSGAYLLCEDLSYLEQIEKNEEYNVPGFNGMGIISENILCHADYFDEEIVDSIANYSLDKNVIMVKNEDVLVIK